MARQPFVWEDQVRRELLDEEVGQIHDLPYSLWRDMIGSPMTKTAEGRDGRRYRVTIEANWAQTGSTDLRITLTLRPAGWSLRRPLRNGFVIQKDGRIAQDLRDA